jgi:hypothetical protein
MADRTKTTTTEETTTELSEEEKASLAEEARKDAADRQAEAEANQTDAQREELAAKRGETHRRDLSDHETALTMEEADEAGFIGTKVDPLPNEAYSVSGVTGGTANAKAKPKSQGGSGR